MKQGHRTNDTITQVVLVADFIVMNSLFVVLSYLYPTILPSFYNTNPVAFMLLVNISMVVSQYFFYNIVQRRSLMFNMLCKRVLKLTLLHVFIIFTGLLILREVGKGGGVSRFIGFYSCLFFLTILLARVCERSMLNSLRKNGKNSRSVVFIGSDPAIRNIYDDMKENPTQGYNVKGYYSNQKMEDRPEELDCLKYLGTIDSLMEMVNHSLNGENDPEEKELRTMMESVDDIYCSLSHSQSDVITALMRYCDHHMIHFYYVPRTFGNIQLKLKMMYFGNYLIYSSHTEPLQMMSNRIAKRMFDIAFSGLVCLCLLPLIPIIAIIIKLQSPGPIFFGQDRTGFNGNTFKCWKFRSMHVNAAADTMQATKDDPRKFAFGNFMRASSIDELPQFFNVLKGDMSIVGPRPHMLHHTDIYGKLIEKYMVRHMSKPGITGWAQVTGFRGETKELWQMEERVKRDIWYIENWSFLLDIKIVFMTAFGMFFNHKNAY